MELPAANTRTDGVEQALRRTHCDRHGHEHQCLGVMTVTPDGVLLDCKLCGKGEGPGLIHGNFVTSEAWEVATRFSRAFGLDWEKLSLEVKHDVCQFANDLLKGALP